MYVVEFYIDKDTNSCKYLVAVDFVYIFLYIFSEASHRRRRGPLQRVWSRLLEEDQNLRRHDSPTGHADSLREGTQRAVSLNLLSFSDNCFAPKVVP